MTVAEYEDIRWVKCDRCRVWSRPRSAICSNCRRPLEQPVATASETYARAELRPARQAEDRR